ncbi:MAG: DNA primase [Candidatus Magasanikbacteria bacterium RIFOXYC2_FULL_39_8]|nr:MAG: DNA primase [Candidatus Magasanikbacteria bacterium RIFOXYC2_FULL_39_8]
MSDDVQLIKDKLDVVDLIGEYVQLKPAGINHKGLCPFHHEKTPSFMASRERQSWHCFGCGKGGDIFTFVEEMEGMEFREALKYLADKAGIQLTNNFQNEVQSSQKNRIKEINRAAALFFHNFLLRMDASKIAREYLHTRKLTDETIIEWQIGFIPDQWDLLTQYLLKKGFAIDDLVVSGLTIKKDNANIQCMKGFYDRFRGRIMFPIWDIHDNVVGFTGRVLVETEHSGGKYVNTPQTPVYDKSRVVFGLNKAKKEIKHKDLIVMVEGQMDVIACHQTGMSNVIATSGTAMTEEQVRLLKRYSQNMNMAFDADAAGIAAAKRGIDIAIEEGMNMRVIQIPDGAGKDPDECIKQNKQTWFDAVAHAEDVMQWYFNRAFAGKDIHNPKQKQVIATELLREIGRIPYAVERDHWLQELGVRLGVDVAVLRDDMARVKSEEKNNKPRNQETKKPTPIQSVEKTRLDLLIERLLILMLRFPDIIRNSKFEIRNSVLSTGPYASLYETVQRQYTSGGIIIDQLHDEFDHPGQENIIDILLMAGEKDFATLTSGEVEKEFSNLCVLIKDEWQKQEQKRLQQEIIQAEKAHDTEKINILMEEFKKLTS